MWICVFKSDASKKPKKQQHTILSKTINAKMSCSLGEEFFRLVLAKVCSLDNFIFFWLGKEHIFSTYLAHIFYFGFFCPNRKSKICANYLSIKKIWVKIKQNYVVNVEAVKVQIGHYIIS